MARLRYIQFAGALILVLMQLASVGHVLSDDDVLFDAVRNDDYAKVMLLLDDVS